MSGLTDSQQEVARILFGLPESTGFALAGGSALVALGVIDRPTRDLDAFVAARAGDPPGDVGPLAATFSATLTGAGWDVEAVRQHQTFVRLVASRDDDSIEVDLAVDSPPIFPVEVVNGIPTLAPQDLAARKVLAVLDRAEGRDFTDLWTLAREHGQTETGHNLDTNGRGTGWSGPGPGGTARTGQQTPRTPKPLARRTFVRSPGASMLAPPTGFEPVPPP